MLYPCKSHVEVTSDCDATILRRTQIKNILIIASNYANYLIHFFRVEQILMESILIWWLLISTSFQLLKQIEIAQSNGSMYLGTVTLFTVGKQQNYLDILALFTVGKRKMYLDTITLYIVGKRKM